MKLPWKLAIGCFAAAAILAGLDHWHSAAEHKAAQETRLVLRSQGFKTDLAEFDFSVSPEIRARVAALTNISLGRPGGRYPDQFLQRARLLQAMPELMQAIGPNSALVRWRQETWPAEGPPPPHFRHGEKPGEDLWPKLRGVLLEYREALDAAEAAAISGPIRFDLNAGAGFGLILPHLVVVEEFERLFGSRTLLELHDGDIETAWTNVLAATRLVAAWEPEPLEISALTRFSCAAIAFKTTWQALQTNVWSDARLEQLQREWESVDFFKGIPKTAAFQRASIGALSERARQEPVTLFGGQLVQSPAALFSEVISYRKQLSYRQHGSYEDEKNLLLYFRDRELELRRAIQATTWLEMRPLPGVTNVVQFNSRHESRLRTILHLRQLGLTFRLRASLEEAQSLLGRAAEAESRRRLIVTALAVERYRSKHGAYPETLQTLAPSFLKTRPMDFMDGQPLRYRLADHERFLLYSVGLDCQDDGGITRRPGTAGADLVWPIPALPAEVNAFEQERLAQREERALAE